MPLTAQTSGDAAAPAALAIRPATSADYAAAVRLFQTTMGEPFTLDPELWRAVCETDGHLAVVGEADGEIAGLAVVIVSDRVRLASGVRRRRYHLDELIVHPTHRRKGYAKALLEYVREQAARHAPSYIIVNCDFMNVAARRTYESAGLYLVRQASDRFEIAFP